MGPLNSDSVISAIAVMAERVFLSVASVIRGGGNVVGNRTLRFPFHQLRLLQRQCNVSCQLEEAGSEAVLLSAVAVQRIHRFAAQPGQLLMSFTKPIALRIEKLRSNKQNMRSRLSLAERQMSCSPVDNENDVTVEMSQEDGAHAVSSPLISDTRRQIQSNCFTSLRMTSISNRSILAPVKAESLNKKSNDSIADMNSGTPPSSPEEFLFADLPDDVRQLYQEKRKIKNLYDWQKQCLSDKRLLGGTNMVISLPTGAGKTLVAEVLMLREAIIRKRSCILMVPYVAIAQEKVQSLCVFEERLPLLVEEYAASKGRLPPIKRRNKTSLYVGTIEKANMLINSLIEVDRIHEVGIVVVDELHMLGEGSRGTVIEQALTKFMCRGNFSLCSICVIELTSYQFLDCYGTLQKIMECN
ncbi:unnamed protein product [Toxocara canis]|uniref:Helicase ATP-binding domain-containing protein n=1 Tax=Toxocara canis TaxID=6265 RepID=A0A183VB36_TOXCA|nr:unnamed protein product [Toxocara canis]